MSAEKAIRRPHSTGEVRNAHVLVPQWLERHCISASVATSLVNVRVMVVGWHSLGDEIESKVRVDSAFIRATVLRRPGTCTCTYKYLRYLLDVRRTAICRYTCLMVKCGGI